MKQIDAFAADYWIENTQRIYAENLHVSSPVMDAYRAGFEKARAMAVELCPGSILRSEMEELGEAEESSMDNVKKDTE